MWLTLNDLRCSQCGASVHPLLDVCPGCDAAHPSLLREAAAGPIGAVRLEDAPETQTAARNLLLRYTMKVNSIGSSAADATLVDAVALLAEALTYRIAGDAVPPTDNAAIALRDGNLVARVKATGAFLAEIPLSAIVGTAAQHGGFTVDYAASPTPGAGGSPVGAPSAADRLRLVVVNRRGLLVSKARDDHFVSLAQWLGVLAAAAAERRWMEVGLPAYLAELGPAAGGLAAADEVAASEPVAGDRSPTLPWPVAGSPEPTAERAAPLGTPGVPPAAGLPPVGGVPSSVQTSLVELESLRAAGLVTGDEYAEKRREILARL